MDQISPIPLLIPSSYIYIYIYFSNFSLIMIEENMEPIFLSADSSTVSHLFLEKH